MGKILNKPARWLYDEIPTGLIGDVVDNGSTVDISNISMGSTFTKVVGLQLDNYSMQTLYNHPNINFWAAFKPTNNSNFTTGLKVESQEIVYPTRTGEMDLEHWIGYNHDAPAFEPVSDSSIKYPDSAIGTTIIQGVQLNLPEFDFRTEIEGMNNVNTITIKTVSGGVTREYSNNIPDLLDTGDPDFWPSSFLLMYEVYVYSGSIGFSLEVLLKDFLGTTIAKLDEINMSGSVIVTPTGTIRNFYTASGKDLDYVAGNYYLSSPEEVQISASGYNQNGLYLPNRTLNIYVRGINQFGVVGSWGKVGELVTPPTQYEIFGDTFTVSNTAEETIDVYLTEGILKK